MRAKTIKRWAILIAVLSLVGGTGFLTQRLQVIRLAKSVAKEAEIAVKEGNLAKAERLYWEHLVIFPDDVETKINYAAALLKRTPSRKRQLEALEIYADILTRNPGRNDVRRKQMELKISMGRLRDEGAEADVKILLNMPENKNDGNLLFLMGRCCEDGNDDMNAVIWYHKAIEHHAPQQIEAYQRRATLLRGQLNEPEAGDKAIEAMVQSAPDNYLVYLVRGRYRRQFKLPGSGADLQKAMALAEDLPKVYLELAESAEAESGYDAARQILEVGLKKAPASAPIYEALANLEMRTGHSERAVETLERGLTSPADKTNLHWILASCLAARGDTGKLLLQIEKLKSFGYNHLLIDFMTACYHINMSEFRKARQLLVPLESVAGLSSELKAQVSDLLARCYSQLGEPEMQQEAYIRALRSNPQDLTATLGMIAHMVKQGEVDEAIKQYRLLVDRAPQVWLPLARLLIARNQQLRAPQHDWSEVKSLIDDAEKSWPELVDVPIVRAEAYMAQNKFAEARNELDKAKLRFPKNVAIWGAQAGLLGVQKKFDEAQRLLDQAKSLLGDRVELRLQRARLAVSKGGPEVVAELNKLGQNIESFSREDRRTLLNGLAIELMRQQDLQDAIRLWSRLAEQEPNDLELRLTLLDLAFQTANRDEIDRNIEQISQIEGREGLLARYCQVRDLIWQAQRANNQEALRLRTEARILLNELASRRANWSVIPLALAELEQQELAQGNLNADDIRTREESIIRSYRRAIDLGQRSSAVVRRTVQLLFKNKRGNEALDLLSSVPLESQLAGDLGRQASRFAVENRDFQRAEEIARKMVAANPDDFQERIWLVQVLLNSGRLADAETEIHQAVELSKGDPDRWITLVRFMIFTKQPENALKAIAAAAASLPQPQVPLTLAECYELLGRAYEASSDEMKKKWYAEAKQWFEKARAAHPDDLSIARRFVDFLGRTKQIDEVEAQLTAILKRPANRQSTETLAWARRTLALTLASSTDIQRVHRALSILRPIAQPAATDDQRASTLEDPEDLRVLARVLEAQGTVQDRKRAIDVLGLLVSTGRANAEDRFLMARLHELDGNWPKAREAYRDLNLRTRNLRDLETLSRRPSYLAQFTRSLLRHHKTGDDQDLTEAQLLVDELKQLQPDQLGSVILQVEVYRARGQLDKAGDFIKTLANRANLAPNVLQSLAQLAEQISRLDIAEELYRRYAALLNPRDAAIVQAYFLGRCGRVKEALDLCEPLWADAQNIDKAAATCTGVIAASKVPPDPAQVDRVAGWLERAIKQKTDPSALQLALGNFRERQKRYDDAKTLYQSVINHCNRSSVKSSDKQMLAISYNNLAWLLAMNDGQGKAALTTVDHAINLGGALADYFDTRGAIYLSVNRTQDAINDFESAVKAGRSPCRLFHLAQAYLHANNKDKARQYWKGFIDKKVNPIGFGPGGIHPLEEPAYRKILSELGPP